MSSSNQFPVTDEEVLAHLKEHFNVVGTLQSLGSCQDFNFKLVSNNGNCFVAKYANKKVKFEELKFQHQVLEYLHSSPLISRMQFPFPQRTIRNETIAIVNIHGDEYYLSLLTFIKGKLLSDFPFLDNKVLCSFGSDIALISESLGKFPHPIVSRDLQWDPKKAFEVFLEDVKYIKDENERNILDCWARTMHSFIVDHKALLRTQLVHGDLAHYNVIASTQENGRPQIAGVIDFGDTLSTWLVGDLSIAIAPLIARSDRDIMDYTIQMVKGFTSIIPLNEIELECLWPLVALRCLVLYVSIVRLLSEDPENKYLQDEVLLNAQAIQKIYTIRPDYATVAIRLAAGQNIDPQISKPFPLWGSETPDLKILDLSIPSLIYEPGSWLKHDALNTIVSSEVLTCSNNQMLVLPYGKPWFCRSSLRSLEAPATVPSFATINLPFNFSIFAPFTGKVEPLPEKTANYQLLSSFIDLTENHKVPFAFKLIGEAFTLICIGENPETFVSYGQIYQEGQLLFRSSPTNRQFFLMQISANHPEIESLHNLEELIAIPWFCTNLTWSIWKHLSFDPFSCITESDQFKEYDSTLEKRYKYVASCQQHYFADPPCIERGYQEFMYDIYGRSYLDMVNNVAVVGHAHPLIAKRTFDQLRILNTNSRFIYSCMNNYAERIIQTIPAEIRAQNKLTKVIFVNSGSEATDLALRMSRSVASSRRRKALNNNSLPLFRDVICIEGGYHGVTTTSDEVSTTLNDNPRSLETRAPWIHLVKMPNLFRGKFRLDQSEWGNKELLEAVASQYVELVRIKVEEMISKGHPPSAFIAEPLSGNAGGVTIPPSYLSKVYEIVREAGGLCICDEVQVGYGRLGSHFWGFIDHDVVPDIITMAKAAGNGHPIGFVITSDEIAKEFEAEESSFFSSAGGNPVSSIVGTTVIDIIEQEKLQQNAHDVGDYLHQELLKLKSKHPNHIGAIHGYGLYQGVEIIRGPISSEDSIPVPATAESYAICERLLDLGVICHNTGDYSNVLKVKPPLYFSREDADFFVKALDITLQGW